MPTTYSTSLRLSLIGDGEGNGTWGSTTNSNLGTLLEAAISGVAQVSVTASDVTLTANNGAVDESRNAVIELTGTSTGARNVIVPTVEKLYLVFNNTSGGYTHTVKTSAGTGLAIPSGKKAWVYCDGTNVVEGMNYATTLLSLTGGALTGPLLLPNGAVGAPSLGFSSDSDTGLFWNSSGSFSATNNGAATVIFAATTTINALAVNGAATFGGAVTHSSTLAQVGASTFTGTATFNGNTVIGSDSADTATVNASVTFNGPVSFVGVPTFAGNVTIGDASSDTLTVNSTSTFAAGVTFSSTTAHTGASTFASTATFNGAVTNNAAVTHNSTLAQVGASTFTAAATFNGAVTMNDAVTLGNATGDAVTVTGNTTVGSSTTLSKQSAGSFISHGSSSHASGVITVSASSPSGGSNGDIWFQI